MICPAPPSGDSENGPRSAELPENIPADGGPKFGWFRILNISARNWIRPASPRNPTFVSFTSEKSQFLKCGPGMISRPEVPSWPIVQGQPAPPCSEAGLTVTGGIENMAGLYHWLTLPLMTVLGLYGIGV